MQLTRDEFVFPTIQIRHPPAFNVHFVAGRKKLLQTTGLH